MRPEDIQEYIASKRVEAKADATHISMQPSMSLRISDDEEGQDQFAKFIYEANRLKDPVPVREVLTPKFALHFNLEIKGVEANDNVIKQVSGGIGKALCDYYPHHDSLTAVIYGAKLDGALKGQVVFPDILVDVERCRVLRTLMVEHLSSDGGATIGVELARLHATNNLSNVIKEVDAKNGVEVPLAATTRIPVNQPEAPLNPVALANISKARVEPRPPPTDRFRWVMLGLKRRTPSNPLFRELTEWIEPRSITKGPKGAGEGSSGKSSGGSTGAPTQPRTGYSGGGDKHGK